MYSTKQTMLVDSMREELKDYGKNLSCRVIMVNNRYYVSLGKDKNFAEIHKNKSRLYISVIAESLPPQLLEKCTIAPESSRWVINAKFKVEDEEGLLIAKEMIELSRAYRSKTTTIRKSVNRR